MTIESAWDAECRRAGDVMGDDVQRLLAQADGYAKRIAELEAEVERLRAVIDRLHDEKAEDRARLWRADL